MVIIIIEEARAVERIDEIAATPGVDVLFIGTSDLSFSLGLRGNQDEPKLEAAIARIAEAGQAPRKIPGPPGRHARDCPEVYEARILTVSGADRSGPDGRRRAQLSGAIRQDGRRPSSACPILKG